ncbi:MAG: hypothetical protein H7831_12710 [Magnetococcus sp. WYHC-3]
MQKFLLAWTLLGVVGCASIPTASAPVHVTVTTTGMVRYQETSFAADQLPARLRKAGVNDQQEIRVHLSGSRQTTLIRQMNDNLRQNGYHKILFLAEPRATSEVVGAPETRTESPIPSSPSVAP